MDQIMGIVNWVKLHWLEIAQAIAAIIGAASIVVKLTPTIKDDEILGKIKNFIGKYIALNVNINSTEKK